MTDEKIKLSNLVCRKCRLSAVECIVIALMEEFGAIVSPRCEHHDFLTIDELRKEAR
jgi:hypothetical protein